MSHHHHHHDHGHGIPRNRRRLAITLALAGGYMFAELIGGWLANSLALLADAGHMFSDVAALALSFFAMWMAERPSPSRRTFGYHRAEILAAMVNGALLIAVSTYIVVEAIHRLRNPANVHGQMMMGIAVGFSGVVVLVGPEALKGLGSDALRQGAVAGGALCYAVATITARLLPEAPPAVRAAAVLMWSAVQIVPVALILDGDFDNALDTNDNIEIGAGITLTSAGSLTLDATTGGISAAGAVTLTATGGITINDIFTAAGLTTMETMVPVR